MGMPICVVHIQLLDAANGVNIQALFVRSGSSRLYWDFISL
jgi:hypothetical protein